MVKNSTSQTQDAQNEELFKALLAIRSDLVSATAKSQRSLSMIHSNYRDSARNLVHYLTFRRHDHRGLQIRLAEMGLSSLGRAESHILATIDSVLTALNAMTSQRWQLPTGEDVIDFATGKRLLAEHTHALLGNGTPGRSVRIMVTMPSEAGDDCTIIHNLLQQGMDCMRINCAHDDPDTWLRMIEHLKRAEKSLGRSCRVVMDLAGPKLRTGPLEPGPTVLKIRPSRDVFGRITAPARVWFTPEESPQPSPSAADAAFLVPRLWLDHLRTGEEVRLTDARGSPRRLLIVDVTEGGCWAESAKTVYAVPETVLRLKRRVTAGGDCTTVIGYIAPTEKAIDLRQGDLLELTRDQRPGRDATYDSSGKLLTPARIGCSLPAMLDDVKAGDSIWFDDGRLGGVIEKVESNHVRVRITHARLRGEKLRAEKGINLPDSSLRLAALTNQDLQVLPFVAQHADVIELSFANTVQDVELLQEHLARQGGRRPAIVLKIETRRGFENLPDMLLTAMRMPNCGVMIARGDLAVEVGFERLAEVQEEILWICEAAHVPVIWATQVLESLAKDGIPSRAEITDAAMGDRAECVMLNKGPHMLSAVRVLDNILRRMQGHQTKKRAMLRELHLAHLLSAETND